VAVSVVELALTAFVVVMLVAQLVSQKSKLPYTLTLVFVGVAITAISTLPSLGSNPVSDTVQSVISQLRSFYSGLVYGGLFVGLVVPPLIFEAMMHVKAPDLRAVIRPSVLLATVGVVIATVVGGLTLWQLAGLSVTVSFLFAAIIAPTDVVTVIEVFQRVEVPSKLSTLMDTEAAFNDATGIVVFTLVLSSVNVARLPILSSLTLFVFTTLGGAAVGLVIAFAASEVIGSVKDRMGQVVLTVSAVYGSYVFASGLGVSGLIAVAAVGLYFGNVTMRESRGPSNKDSIFFFWQIAAFIGNSVAFLLIGFETNLVSLYDSIGLILVAYAAVSLARAASVYPIIAVFSRVSERIPVTWSNVAMLGGVRGALSIALAASLSVSAAVSGSDISTIETMVFGVAFLSIAVQTPLLSRYVGRRYGNRQLA
jgi:CPA1 family monovalent cation:H+ antiporter